MTHVTDLDISGFESIRLPHNMVDVPLAGFSHQRGEISATYVRTIDSIVPDDDHELHVCFGAVMTRCQVYWNDEELGTHEGGYVPFSFRVPTHLIREKNRLTVFVDGREIDDIPPFGGVVDYLPYSGIYREVHLDIVPTSHLEEWFIKTREMPDPAADTMLFECAIKGDFTQQSPLTARMTIHDDEGREVCEDTFTLEDSSATLSMPVGPIERWDLDHPILYHLTLRLEKDGVPIDEVHDRFGFRHAKFAEDGFYLNGEKITLVGLNRHQSYPHVGYAMPARMQARDAEWLKHDLGCNIVRTSHYMQSDHFIRRCDEIGLLVFEEIPGWQHIGDDTFKQLTYEHLRVMIEHHRNHPSIVLWGVRINESADDHDFYKNTNDIARACDDTRQTAGVRNFPHSECLEDVYTMNDFSHTGTNRGLMKKRTVTKKHIPYLVTEHNGHMYPVKKSDPESKRVEQAMRHANVLESAFKETGIAGAIGWCMFDYNTHPVFGSGDMICHHGVMDMSRIPKPAAAIYASQSDHHPVLEVMSEMTMGEHPKSMLPTLVVATNCDYVEVYHSGHFIDRFHPAKKKYPHLPHPPVFVDDLIGERFARETDLNPRAIRLLKKLIRSYEKHGMDLPLWDKLRVLRLMVFHHVGISEIMDLYGRFIGDWGNETGEYKFVGFKNGRPVKTSVKGPSKSGRLKIDADDLTLTDGMTYDATRIVVRLVDQNDNVIRFVHHPIRLNTTKQLEVMGPDVQSLNDGSVGFFVKTTGVTGHAIVTAVCEGYDDVVTEIEVVSPKG